MNSFSSGFRPTLADQAQKAHQAAKLDLPGRLPASATYIDPGMITQPTGAINPMPVNNLPLNELGLGLTDAMGDPGGANPFMGGRPGGFVRGTPNTSELQEAQLKAMEQQQDIAQWGSTLSGAASGAMLGAKLGSAVPVVGTIVGAVLGGAIGWLAGD